MQGISNFARYFLRHHSHLSIPLIFKYPAIQKMLYATQSYQLNRYELINEWKLFPVKDMELFAIQRHHLTN